ncbi:MAG TPA: dihydrofolate reductase [Gammaproteobacteria bacterium]|nr:dihydrofolate reductase [Gammaproteobacteria bacterium]
MQLAIIAAVAENGCIGRNNALPWHLPADLSHFKLMTWGKPVIMGRRTFEAIGKPLRGRLNIVVTHDAGWRADGVSVAHSLDEAIKLAGNAQEAVIIGGAQLYAECLPKAQRLYITRVHAEVDGDTFFPPLDMKQWREVARSEHPRDARNPYDMTFITLERVR